jgi:hypothetical protein
MDYWLSITPKAAGKLLLSIYDTPPAQLVRSIASTVLPALPYDRLGTALHQLLLGETFAPEAVGDCLAEWFFVAQSGTQPYNPVGTYLHQQSLHVDQRQRLRVWICIDPVLTTESIKKGEWIEFRDVLPFECLTYNRILPVQVVRSVIGNSQPSEHLGSLAKLRVLFISANPAPGSAYAHLDSLDRSFTELVTTLDPLKHAGELFLESWGNATSQQMQEALIHFNPHVLVFAGHGYGTGQGGLVCVRDGAPDYLPFPELLQAVRTTHKPALRLAVFIACQSFVAAGSFLATGVPAVVAMQPLVGRDFPVLGLPAFAQPFFHALAHHESISDAHAAACRALASTQLPYAAVMPTLWLATPHDPIIDDPRDRLQALYLDALLGKPEISMLPLPGKEGGALLPSLYVHQALVAESATQADDAHAVAVYCWKALQQHPRVLIEAPVWAGKSALCRAIVQQCAKETGWLPIFFNFHDFAQSEKSLQAYLNEEYTEWLGWQERYRAAHLPEGDSEHLSLGSWLWRMWQEGRALLVVDGVDEEGVPALRQQALRVLTAPEHLARPRVLLTSRPLAGEQPSGFAVFQLPEWQDAQQAELVRLCGEIVGHPDKAEPFIQTVQQQQTEHRWDLAASPGHLVHLFAAYALLEGVSFVDERALMSRVVEGRFALTGRTSTTLEPDDPTYKRQVAEAMSFHLLLCRGGAPQSGEALHHLVQQVFDALQSSYLPWSTHKECTLLLEDLCCNSGFLRRTPTGEYEWESPAWLHYFAGCYLDRKLQDGDVDFTRWVAVESEPTGTTNRRVSRTQQSLVSCPVCINPLPSVPAVLRRLH